MAIQNFTLYDLIVDLTPGIVAIFVFVPLFPPESVVAQLLFGNSFQFGLSLLVLGYVAGRFLHAISGSMFARAFHSEIDKYYFDVYRWLFSEERSEWVTKSLFHRASKDCFDGNSYVPPISEQVQNKEPIKAHEVCHRACKSYLSVETLDECDEIHRFKHFGESLLYGERRLYRKYEMLSTFFRNLAFLFSVTTVVYWLYLHGLPHSIERYPSIWTENTGESYPYYSSIYFFFILGVLCHTQRLKFKYRKRRAFIDDLYIKLVEEDSDWLFEDTNMSGDDTQ